MQGRNVIGDRRGEKLEDSTALAHDLVGGTAIEVGLNQPERGNDRLGIGERSFHMPLWWSMIYASERLQSRRTWASVVMPAAIWAGEEYSSGRWLTPSRQGMKIIVVGQIMAMKSESW
jgi:hypothetical protein